MFFPILTDFGFISRPFSVKLTIKEATGVLHSLSLLPQGISRKTEDFLSMKRLIIKKEKLKKDFQRKWCDTKTSFEKGNGG